MKTNSLILGAAALMLATSCSNDEVVKVAENGAAIGFSSFVNNSVRADYDTENLPADLKVYGLTSRADGSVPLTSIFNGEVLEKESNWTYSPLRYWVAGNDYSFAAFAPATENVSGVEMAVAGLTFSFDNEKAGATEDLLYAYDSRKPETANGGTVEFTFSHMLSRAAFEFTSAVKNENIRISISDVKINNAATAADFTGAVKDEQDKLRMTWEKAVASDLSVNFGYAVKDAEGKVQKDDNGVVVTEKESGVLAKTAVTETSHMYLIPMSEEVAYNVTFTVTVHQKDLNDETGNTFVAMEKQNLTATIPAKTYLSGYSYTFKATIDDDNMFENERFPILFNVAGVDGWDSDTENAEIPETVKNNN